MATELQLLHAAGQTISSLEAERDLYKRRLETSEECRNNLFTALQSEREQTRKVLDQIYARARALPGDDLKELQRQMMHIASLSEKA